MVKKKMNNFYENLFIGNYTTISDKEKEVKNLIKSMLIRTSEMFTYENLPETIPQNILELMVQTAGYCGIIKFNDKFYAVNGGVSGEPSPYHTPTNLIVANPALKLIKTYIIDTDCVIIPNDSLYLGLIPICNKYASLLIENEISIRVATINKRIPNIITANTDKAKKDGERYLSKVENGDLGIYANSAFLDSVNIKPYNPPNTSITDLIEMEQYLKASWYNELGLNANYNMKRESINSVEAQLDDDALIPLPENMLRCRQKAVEKINNMFGLNISVDLSSSWRVRADENIKVDKEGDNIDDK